MTTLMAVALVSAQGAGPAWAQSAFDRTYRSGNAPLSFGGPAPVESSVYANPVTGATRYSTTSASVSPLALLAVGGGLAAIAFAAKGSDKGDASDPFPTPDPDYDPGEPPARDLAPGDFETAEYQRNYALDMIHASSRYANGGTGWNTTLAVFDTGADVSHVDLAPNVRLDLSYSYFTESADVRDFDGHGSHVASIMAGAKNDAGTHGVAFDAGIMVLQAVGRGDGSVAAMDFASRVADGQRRAIAAGARAINHSWTPLNDDGSESRYITEFTRESLGGYLGSDILEAYRQSTEAGLVTVFATANDGASDPSAMAGIPALFPEFQSTWLAVASINETGVMSGFSNRCGVAAEFCLSAPGGMILAAGSVDAGDRADSFVYKSGTSMAAPHVTGAVGVLASEFPELTGAEIVTILLDTARDAGLAGTDEVYGRGILDLENAIAPQGTLTFANGASRSAGYTPVAESWVAGPSGIAAGLSASLAGTSVMVSDGYERGYGSDMSGFVAMQAASVELADQIARKPMRTASFGAGSSMSIGASSGTPYAEIAGGQMISLDHAAGGLSFSLDSITGGSDAHYLAAGIGIEAGGTRFGVELGQMQETGSMLGAAMTGAFGGAMSSNTDFARLKAGVDIGRSSLDLTASLGRTGFSSTGMFREGAVSSQALSLAWAREGARDDKLSITLSSPLALADGSMTLNTPMAYAAAEDGVRSETIARQTDTVSVKRGAVPIDLGMGYGLPFAGGKLETAAAIRLTGDAVRSGLAVRAGYSLTW